MGKSKTTKTKPGYVPPKGWFFDIKRHGMASRVYLNGQQVPNVTKINIEVSAGEVSKATVEIALVKARAKVGSAKKVYPERKNNAEWAVSD